MNVSTKQQRIAELAKRSPQMGFTSLAYLMDIDWLREAFHRTRKDGATGVDRQTWAQYAKDLETNLQSLLDRVKAGTYRAPPVRRVYIAKAGSTTERRPIGIPTLEDKVLQRAVVMLLDPIYEQDFSQGSYGFRRKRSAHQALEALWQQTMNVGGGWILEVDIRKFFDTLDHAHLRSFLRLRVLDGVLIRLIGKWLKAGILEDGNISYPDTGSPQGGVISPILANIFLHYVLDEWFAQEVQPRLHGRAYLARYADDFVILFTHEGDAHRVMEVLPKRFGKFGLTLHPDKTRLVPFHCPARKARSRIGERDPGTFDLLGFTHYWGRGRRGHWMVMRKTSSKRLTRAVRSVAQWCRKNRHRPVSDQHAKLCQKVRGHYAYYGITHNSRSLQGFREAVTRAWRKWLSRRNSRREMTWERFARLLTRYPLPRPRIVHSYVK
ncbi:MAG: group II intron reverse transcriptase/maturase [Thermoguttaceae bacterium]